MPTYTYECQKCLEKSEVRQKIEEAPISDCNSCQSKGTMKRLISSGAFLLIGKGWFKDGY